MLIPTKPILKSEYNFVGMVALTMASKTDY